MPGPGPGAGGGYPRIFFKKNKNPGHLYFHMVYFLDVGVDYNHIINDVVCPPGILGCLANTGPKCLLGSTGSVFRAAPCFPRARSDRGAWPTDTGLVDVAY